MDKNEPFSGDKFFLSLFLLIVACSGFILVFTVSLESIEKGTVLYFLIVALKILCAGIVWTASLYLTFCLLVFLWYLMRGLILFISNTLRTFYRKFMR